MSKHLDRLARRVESDPFFLAAPLARYAASEKLTDDALAAQLGLDREALQRLRLCRNPDPLPPAFGKDVEQIAARFHLDPDRLAEIVRLGQALLQSEPPADRSVPPGAGHLLAAREDAPEEPSPGEEP